MYSVRISIWINNSLYEHVVVWDYRLSNAWNQIITGENTQKNHKRFPAAHALKSVKHV